MRSHKNVSPHPVLQELIDEALAADPDDIVLCPVGAHVYATLFGVVPDIVAVLRSAARIETDRQRLLEWYVSESIDSLDHLTAAELVGLDHADRVIAWLQHIAEDTG
jgi:hypothetical protein